MGMVWVLVFIGMIFLLTLVTVMGAQGAKGHGSSDAPTFRQLDYIDALKEERHVPRFLIDEEPETKAEASSLIDQLLDCPERKGRE